MSWIEDMNEKIDKVVDTLEKEIQSQNEVQVKFEDQRGKENLYHYLLSVYLYLHETEGKVRKEAFTDYIAETLKYIYLVQTMDYHLVNTAKMKYSGGSTKPYTECSRIAYANDHDRETFTAYLQTITHLQSYDKLLTVLKECYGTI